MQVQLHTHSQTLKIVGATVLFIATRCQCSGLMPGYARHPSDIRTERYYRYLELSTTSEYTPTSFELHTRSKASRFILLTRIDMSPTRVGSDLPGEDTFFDIEPKSLFQFSLLWLSDHIRAKLGLFSTRVFSAKYMYLSIQVFCIK